MHGVLNLDGKLWEQLRYAYGITRCSAVWWFCELFAGSQIVLVLFVQALLGWVPSDTKVR